MSSMYQLPFEKPIYDLENQLAELEASSNGQFGVSDEVQRMRREIDGLKRKVSPVAPWGSASGTGSACSSTPTIP